jgi:hypothetical protein
MNSTPYTAKAVYEEFHFFYDHWPVHIDFF